MKYDCVEINDLPTVIQVDTNAPVARALTMNDGRKFAEAMNAMVSGTEMRDRLLSAVTDAIEDCFEA